MSKRLLECIVLFVVLVASTRAHALTTTPASPIDIGTTGVGTPVQRMITIDGQNPAQTLDHFDYSGAACPRFTVVPAMALPQTLNNGSSLNTTITFTPNARGAASCTVTMRDNANASLGSFQITGIGLGPEINIVPVNGPPLDFGDIRVLDTAVTPSSDRTVRVENIGDGGFNLTLNSITGLNGTNFSVVTTGFPITIPAGGNTTITLRFNPSTAGVRNATATFNSNSPTAAPTLQLTGDGTNARISVTSSSTFTGIATTATGSIAVTNTGANPQGPLRVTGGTIAGGDGWFTFEDNGVGCSGATCAFNTDVTTATPLDVAVRCTPLPGAVGARTATFTFTSDTDAGGDNTVQLTCTGRADHAIDTTMLAFGTQLVNTTSAPRTVTVTNTGSNIDLVITSITKSAGGAVFILGGTCGTTCNIPAGMSRTFTVAFAPTAPNADASSTLTVNLTDPDGNPTIALTGRGIAPIIEPPASAEFATVEVGKMGMQTVTIRNGGEAPLTISNVVLSANATQYSVLTGMTGPQMTVVDPGLTASWTVSCNPTTFGDIPGDLVVASNGFGVPSVSIPLNCTGQQGVLVATTAGGINFGSVPEMAQPADRSITIRNSGNLPITGISATLQPATSYFSIVTGPPAMLDPGATATVTVRYRPITGTDDGPVNIVFSGVWGSTNTPIPAFSVPVQGDALLNGFDVTPSTLALGDVRFDRTTTAKFCVRVTGQSEFDLTMVQITPMAGTMSNEFTVSEIRRAATCGGGNVVTLPQHLGPMVANSVLEFTVVADPQDRIGPMAATLTVISNLPGPLTRNVMLSANATSAMLAVDPGTNIDFGPVDVQAAMPTTRRVTITNMGQAPLDLTSFTRSDMMGTPSTLTFTLPGNTTLAPNESVAVDITYQPTTVEPLEVHLGAQVAGVFGAPASATIVIRGRGIDRDFMLLSDMETFPPTFRNPGSMAPIRPITVRNLGDAPLAISALTLVGDNGVPLDPEVWQLVDPSPVVIPGQGSHEFLVKFAPKAAGSMDAALLEMMHDDDMDPMTPIARVPLRGSGIDRMANFATEEVHLGYTGVGIPYRFDGIEIVSMDPDNEFTIRELGYENQDVFEIDDLSNAKISPAGTVTFGVTFKPEAAGSSETIVELFLDEDPIAQGRKIKITGDAVFVDAHGGGGCSTSSNSGGFVGGLLVAVAAMLARRRRVLVAAAVAAASPASADNIVLSVFDPTPSTATASSGFQAATPEVAPDGAWVVSAVASYATDQFVHDAYLADGVLLNGHAAVKQSTLMLLGGAYALKGFEFGARMPMYSQQGDAFGDRTTMYPGDPVSGTARGDLTLHGKYQLVHKQLEGKGLFAFGPALQVTLPTATEDQFTGVDYPSVRALALMTLRPGAFDNRVTFNINAGVIGRAQAEYASLQQKSGGTWALGISLRALERVWLAGEMFGDVIPGGNQRMENASMTMLQPIEWLVGARWLPDHRFAVGVAGGRGLTSSAGSPALRGVLTLTFSPSASKPARLHVPAIDLDSDEDGLKDSVDKCKFEPEDKDQFEDSDGCIDKDNDGDKLADADDKCPMEAEDFDEFEDTDGCVDKDNDRDGVLDTADKCKGYPEDKDGFEDADGCPELDNDKDGLPDKTDQCLNDPETINGNKDDDGCPDNGDSLVILSPDRIELMENIKFDGATTKLSKSTFNVLGQVAATLRAHPEIIRMRVTVHVHDNGDGADPKDQELSDKRAQVIRDWIVQWGIAASRVEARGFGATKMQGKTRAMNDRVELIILERK